MPWHAAVDWEEATHILTRNNFIYIQENLMTLFFMDFALDNFVNEKLKMLTSAESGTERTVQISTS